MSKLKLVWLVAPGIHFIQSILGLPYFPHICAPSFSRPFVFSFPLFPCPLRSECKLPFIITETEGEVEEAQDGMLPDDSELNLLKKDTERLGDVNLGEKSGSVSRLLKGAIIPMIFFRGRF